MPGIEEAQREARRQRPTRQSCIQAGQRMPPLVQGAQHILGVLAVPIAEEGSFGLLVGIQRTLIVGGHSRVVAGTRHEVVGGHSLAESRDLGVDAGQFPLVPAT